MPYQRISREPIARATGFGVKSIMVGTVYRAAPFGSRISRSSYTGLDAKLGSGVDDIRPTEGPRNAVLLLLQHSRSADRRSADMVRPGRPPIRIDRDARRPGPQRRSGAAGQGD